MPSLPQPTTRADISVATLQQAWPRFEAQILALLARLTLSGKQLECDHVALRVNSIAAADALRDEFCQMGRIISDNQINGRCILIFELTTPLILGEFSIACVELPYPSDKHYPQEGWEHIELVLPSTAQDCAALSQDLLSLCPSLSPLFCSDALHGNDIKLKMSSPKADKERLANPTIAFKYQDVCIKVHPHGIKAVIASEQPSEQPSAAEK
ncbi:MAG: VOC family protein [Shewanella sp.]